MKTRLLLILTSLLIGAGAASAQVVQVHDLNWYGLVNVVPDPVEIDGNPATLEFVLWGVDRIELMNPYKLIEGKVCRELVRNPIIEAYGSATMITMQTVRIVNGRAFIMTWGVDVMTGQAPYDLRPAEFVACR